MQDWKRKELDSVSPGEAAVRFFEMGLAAQVIGNQYQDAWDRVADLERELESAREHMESLRWQSDEVQRELREMESYLKGRLEKKDEEPA